VEIPMDFEVGRPAGLAPGTPIDLTLAMNIGPLPIPPGGRYEWRLTIDDETQDEWRTTFTKLKAMPEQPGLPGEMPS
jgi:hypothetical protein